MRRSDREAAAGLEVGLAWPIALDVLGFFVNLFFEPVQMRKTVIDCGNCDPDHHAIRSFIESKFDAKVIRTQALADTLDALEKSPADLILVNRKLDVDYSDGIEVIKEIKRRQELANIPAMLITNYEEYQQAALADGAVTGFGKKTMRDPSTVQTLSQFLGEPVA